MRIFFLLAIILILSGLSGAVYASMDIQPSNARDVAFSFHKTAGTTPNFLHWIKNSHPILSTPLAKQKEVIAQENQNLKTAFENFNPLQSPLVIRTKMRVTPAFPADPIENPIRLKFSFDKVQDPNEVFFPYSYGSDNFAVIIDDITDHMEAEVDGRQHGFIVNNLRGTRVLTAILTLAPYNADTQQPYPILDKDHWLLATKLAGIEIYNNNGVLIYENFAAWNPHATPMQLNKLHDQKQENQRLQSLEPFKY